MNTIKFSHKYSKLPWGIKEATLIDVWEIDRKQMSPYFIDYDTKHPDGNYHLKSGKYLVLLLHNGEQLFTTLRTACPTNKVDYYRSQIGKVFGIKVEASDE